MIETRVVIARGRARYVARLPASCLLQQGRKRYVLCLGIQVSVCCTCMQEEVESPDVHFEPVVKLPPVQVKTHEEEELEIFKM